MQDDGSSLSATVRMFMPSPGKFCMVWFEI